MIRFFDMFAGIGGFRTGLKQAGGYTCVGYCEQNKYALAAYRALYDTEKEVFFHDAKTIHTAELPDFDLLCAGFPCQPFSVAGKREGFGDARGTLFEEITRVAAARRPAFLLLENVPGLLSHDQGRTFQTILARLYELGYALEWCVCNSKNFGVPQDRKRLYLVGFLDSRHAGKIFPLGTGDAPPLAELISGRQGRRVYRTEGVACTQTANAGGLGGKTGLYFIDLNTNPMVTERARCITAKQDSGVSYHRGEHSAVLVENKPRAILTPDKETVRQQGRRMKESDGPMFTITAQDRHGICRHGRIRKLTPLECWRLQGFTDEQFHTVQALGISDTQLYKMAGNAVTTTVVTAIGRKLSECISQS